MSSNQPNRRIAAAVMAALLLPAVASADLVNGEAAAGATPADASAAPTAGEGGQKGLQEIVVTATRHEESLSKVPISVTALSQEAMDTRGIKDFQDIARFTPGVSIDNSGTNAISIRGISSSAGVGHDGHLPGRHAHSDAQCRV